MGNDRLGGAVIFHRRDQRASGLPCRPPAQRAMRRRCKAKRRSVSNIWLAIGGRDARGWEQRFRTLAPQHKIWLWRESFGDPAKMVYACVWNPPAGLLAEFPKLRAIFSIGAGVDDLLADPQL